MKPLSIVIPYSPDPFFKETLLSLTKSPLVERVVIVTQEPVHLKIPRCRVLDRWISPVTGNTQLDSRWDSNELPSPLPGTATNFDRI